MKENTSTIIAEKCTKYLLASAKKAYRCSTRNPYFYRVIKDHSTSFTGQCISKFMNHSLDRVQTSYPFGQADDWAAINSNDQQQLEKPCKRSFHFKSSIEPKGPRMSYKRQISQGQDAGENILVTTSSFLEPNGGPVSLEVLNEPQPRQIEHARKRKQYEGIEKRKLSSMHITISDLNKEKSTPRVSQLIHEPMIMTDFQGEIINVLPPNKKKSANKSYRLKVTINEVINRLVRSERAESIHPESESTVSTIRVINPRRTTESDQEKKDVTCHQLKKRCAFNFEENRKLNKVSILKSVLVR